jgi:hypothetical protein
MPLTSNAVSFLTPSVGVNLNTYGTSSQAGIVGDSGGSFEFLHASPYLFWLLFFVVLVILLGSVFMIVAIRKNKIIKRTSPIPVYKNINVLRHNETEQEKNSSLTRTKLLARYREIQTSNTTFF